jgi:diguanylate cyclase (GGDEF)-like protein
MDATTARQIILIVDDVPINIQVLARALKSDYDVKITTKGEKAIEIASSENPPDLILLDIMMPGMDGYEVCRRLKNNPKTLHLPVIFITAKGEVEDETAGLALGAVDYITKPFHLPIIKARVKTHLHLKRKSDMLERLASLDALTDIPNRRRFDEVLRVEWNRAKRTATPLSLILIDLDYFKSFNDNYGHAAGDECLYRVAQTLSGCLKRAGDFCARYGGEEFVVVLPNTSTEAAIAIAEDIHKHIELLNIPHARSIVSDRVTASLGAATVVPGGDITPDSLLNAADGMLYKAKKAGRTQVKGLMLSPGV